MNTPPSNEPTPPEHGGKDPHGGLGGSKQSDDLSPAETASQSPELKGNEREVEELRKTEARLNFALETMSAGAWELDLVDHTAHRTLIHDQIFGYETLLPKWTFEMFLDHVLPEDRSEVERLFGEATATESEWGFECRIRRVDGKIRWIFAKGTHVSDSVGKPVKIAGIVQDITERKQVEEALKEKTAEMERFTYAVSHDLKSPLVTIRTFLGYLNEDLNVSVPERATTDLRFIHEAAEKMELLLKELLNFVRVGYTASQPVEMSLQEVLHEALSMVAGQIASQGVEVQVTQSPVLLTGDKVRLIEVFQNLIDNAVKFLVGQPNPKLEIGAEVNGNDIVLFVRDNGRGIDPRYQAKVFGLFEKLDQRTPGSGIGLALVRRIVEQHGGKIWLESEGVGLGTTFRFTLAQTRMR